MSRGTARSRCSPCASFPCRSAALRTIFHHARGADSRLVAKRQSSRKVDERGWRGTACRTRNCGTQGGHEVTGADGQRRAARSSTNGTTAATNSQRVSTPADETTRRIVEEGARATVRSTDDVSYRTKWEIGAGAGRCPFPPAGFLPSRPFRPFWSALPLPVPGSLSLATTPSPRSDHHHPSPSPVLRIRSATSSAGSFGSTLLVSLSSSSIVIPRRLSSSPCCPSSSCICSLVSLPLSLSYSPPFIFLPPLVSVPPRLPSPLPALLSLTG